MNRNKQSFRERFKRWQQGESYWDIRTNAQMLPDNLNIHKNITVPFNEEYSNLNQDIQNIYNGGVLPEIIIRGKNKYKPDYSEQIDSYIPSNNVRKHIAEWEYTDFEKQNKNFGGDAIGAKSKEFHNIMKNNYKGFTQQDLDGLFSTYYNLRPVTYKKMIMPYVKNYNEKQDVVSYKDLQDVLLNRYNLSEDIYKNGIKRRAKSDVELMSNRYKDGKDTNTIPEEIQPLVQDEQFQQQINDQKNKLYDLNVQDFLYRTNKFRPNISLDQVQKTYLNTPIISRNVGFNASGQYRSSDPNSDFTNGYIKVSNDKDMPLSRTISHEMRHAYDDQLYNVNFDKQNDQYQYLTRREKNYLNEAYPEEAFSANGDETSEIAERLATNADIRSQISNESGGLIKQDLDDYINNMSDEDLYNIINGSNGYINRNYYVDEQSEPNQQDYGVDKIYNYLNIDPTNGLLKSILNKNAERFIRMNNQDFQKKYNKNSEKFVKKYGQELYDNIRRYQKDKYDWDNGVRKNVPNKEKLDKVRQSILNVAQITNPIYSANKLLLANKGKDNFKYTNKYTNDSNFNKGKDDEEDLEKSVEIGSIVPLFISRRENDVKLQNNKKLDERISKIPYGWDDYGAFSSRGMYSLYNSVKHINPAWSFHDYFKAASSMLDLPFDTKTDMSDATKDDIAFFHRHLGLNRDTLSMPVTGIRFSGDYNKDGTLRLPKAEYTGISKQAKDFIKKGIQNGRIKVNKDGTWTPIKENRRSWSKYTSHLGNYSIRENNGSGIYDLFDTYDFPKTTPIKNRKKGTQIEIRDTIHGNNARPWKYDPNYSSKLKK